MTYATQDYRDRQDYSQALSGDTIVSAVWSIVPSATLDGQVDSSTETRIFVSGLEADTQYILTVRVTGASGEIYDNDATINEQAPPVPVVPVAPAAPTPSTRASRVNATMLRTFGELITYMAAGGLGAVISEKAILMAPEIDQSAAPGKGVSYFADIAVDPETKRARGDKVIWSDGVEYVVAKVVSRPYELAKLALHRKADPA